MDEQMAGSTACLRCALVVAPLAVPVLFYRRPVLG